jgi:hypothetical protein
LQPEIRASRVAAQQSSESGIVMPLRGMSGTILIPGVPLRSTPGYSRFAAPLHI